MHLPVQVDSCRELSSLCTDPLPGLGLLKVHRPVAWLIFGICWNGAELLGCRVHTAARAAFSEVRSLDEAQGPVGWSPALPHVQALASWADFDGGRCSSCHDAGMHFTARCEWSRAAALLLSVVAEPLCRVHRSSLLLPPFTASDSFVARGAQLETQGGCGFALSQAAAQSP